jgi:hypothetical protein
VKDPLGNVWFIAMAKEEVPQAEQKRRWEEIAKSRTAS